MRTLVLKKVYKNTEIGLPVGTEGDEEFFSTLFGLPVEKMEKESFNEWFSVKYMEITEIGDNEFHVKIMNSPIDMKHVLEHYLTRLVDNYFEMFTNLEKETGV